MTETRTIEIIVHPHWHQSIALLGLQFEPGEWSRIVSLEVPWICPECGRLRGEPEQMGGTSYWINPCGHEDIWLDLVKEAVAHRESHAGPQRPTQLTLF